MISGSSIGIYANTQMVRINAFALPLTNFLIWAYVDLCTLRVVSACDKSTAYAGIIRCCFGMYSDIFIIRAYACTLTILLLGHMRLL